MDAHSEHLITQLKTETDPFTRAHLLKILLKEKGLRLSSISKLLSIKPSYLCHYLRLNRLPDLIVDGYYAQDISLSHLFIISRLKDREKIIELYEKILSKNLTVAQTEEEVREMIYGIKTEGSQLKAEEKEKFFSKIDDSVRTKIIQTRIKSKLVFEIKGSLNFTTKKIRELLEKLTD